MHDSEVIEKYLKRVILFKESKSLHEDYLPVEERNEYLLGHSLLYKPEEHYQTRYLNLYHPNSTEFQNLTVDLKLGRQEPNFDYLENDVILPLIDAMVFLKIESNRRTKGYVWAKDSLDRLANLKNSLNFCNCPG